MSSLFVCVFGCMHLPVHANEYSYVYQRPKEDFRCLALHFSVLFLEPRAQSRDQQVPVMFLSLISPQYKATAVTMIKHIYIKCMSILKACNLCMCITRLSTVLGGQKRATDSLELKQNNCGTALQALRTEHQSSAKAVSANNC